MESLDKVPMTVNSQKKTLLKCVENYPQTPQHPIPSTNSPPLFAVGHESPPSPVVSISSSPRRSDLQLWIPKFDLFLQDKQVLASKHWLNDWNYICCTIIAFPWDKWESVWMAINTAEQMQGFFQAYSLYTNFPHFWVSLCCCVKHRCTLSRGIPYWHCWHLQQYQAIHQTKTMVCSFFKCSSDVLHFDLVNVGTQHNFYDCGVYAIANATELTLGRDLVVCRWDHGRNREHLKICLEEGVRKNFST